MQEEYFSSEQNQTELKLVSAALYPRCLKNVFNSIQNLFIDPRDDENQVEFNERKV